MLGRLVDTAGWGTQEWLAAVMLVFILVTLGVVLRRIIGLFRLTRKPRHAPNLRPLRRSSKQSKQKLSSRLSFALLCCAVLPLSSSAIIIRHDISPAQYRARASDYPAVFFLESQGARKVCVATLIRANWALTAAHCLEETSLAAVIARGEQFTVRVANEERQIDSVHAHPLYDQRAANDVDLALLHFSEPLPFPRPMALAANEVSPGGLVQLLGWGFTGQGLSGRDRDDGRFRQASNRVTEVGGRFRVTFDDPRKTGEAPEALEGMPGLGDSGGPALVRVGASWALAGVVVGEVMGPGFSEETQGQYGAVAVFENLARHRDWIARTVGD